jgi:hypothetical protein
MTWALSLIPITAMSVRVLFTSHDAVGHHATSPGVATHHLARCLEKHLVEPSSRMGRKWHSSTRVEDMALTPAERAARAKAVQNEGVELDALAEKFEKEAEKVCAAM